MKRKFSAFWGMVLLAMALAIPSTLWRLAREREAHSALIVFDLLELRDLRGGRTEETIQTLMGAGVSSFLAPEYTGEDLAKGALENVSVLPSVELTPEPGKFASAWGTVLALGGPDAELQCEYLRRRFVGGERAEISGKLYYRIPASLKQLEMCGVLPDLATMRYLSLAGVPIVYAPGPSCGSSREEQLDALAWTCETFPAVKALCPSGKIAAVEGGHAYLGEFALRRGLLMAQVEFSRQYGSGRQVAAAWPNVVSLHGVDREEVLKRGITRPIMLNRLYRAAVEREVRLLVLRLDPLVSRAMSLDEYCGDARTLRARLDDAAFARLWPNRAPAASGWRSVCSAVALHLLLAALALAYAGRFRGAEPQGGSLTVAAMLAFALIVGVASVFARPVLKVSGALAAGLLATEASLLAMQYWKVPLRGAAEALLLVFSGGLALAGAFSTPLYMYRMSTFSGVKLSLLLPPALILLADMKRREHPESVAQVLSRPPLWSELALAGTILLAALVMLLRSGNYGFVSNSEIAFRDWIEKALGARPRTKEFLIGYPALVCWYWLKRHNLWERWREVLRLAVALAFSSAVNSFCHFHTPLSLTLLRGLNGWWTGLLLGVLILVVCVRVAAPLFRRVRGIFS